MTPSPRRRAAAVATVAIVLLSGLAGGVAVAQETGPEGADEVYVSESGDAVLVYDGEGDATDTSAEYGVDVDAGLAYALLESTGVADGSLSGHMTAALTTEAFGAEGNLTAPKPGQLESLSLDLTGATNDEQSTLDATLSTTISETAGLAVFLEAASTEGSITVGADRLQADGQFEASSATITGAGSSMSLTLTEQDGTYTVEVDQQRTVSEFEADNWRTREAARQQLQAQFVTPAQALGGEGSVTIDDYGFGQSGADGYRLELAYTATIEGVEDRLEQALASQLTSAGDLSSSQAEELASALTKISVNEVSISYEVGEGTVTGSATVDVENYADLLLAYFAIAEELGASTTGSQSLQSAREAFEAQQAAGLQQEVSWSADVSAGEQTTVDAEIHQEATNWGAYVEELESRDMPTVDVRFDLSARTSGDRVAMNGSMAYEGDQIVTSSIDSIRNTSDLPEESAQLLSGFERASLQKAKLEIDADEDVRFEVGAAFENLAVLRDSLRSVGDVPAFDSIVGRTDDTSVKTYIRVTGAFDGEPAESAVRALDGVDDETTIHMPGSWDREFPSMDTERAGDFVDVESGMETGATSTASGSGPGFGLLAGILGLLAAALIARRRVS
ncbi:MAG: PGF-CTERM sorting domain-containing protein [Haloarculaceae archaeon]